MPKFENPPPGNAEASSPGASAEFGLFGHLAEPLELVEHAIHEQLASKAEVVQAMGDHVFGAGGKRLRPALLLLAAELCGYTGPRRIHLGAAIELPGPRQRVELIKGKPRASHTVPVSMRTPLCLEPMQYFEKGHQGHL